MTDLPNLIPGSLRSIIRQRTVTGAAADLLVGHSTVSRVMHGLLPPGGELLARAAAKYGRVLDLHETLRESRPAEFAAVDPDSLELFRNVARAAWRDYSSAADALGRPVEPLNL